MTPTRTILWKELGGTKGTYISPQFPEFQEKFPFGGLHESSPPRGMYFEDFELGMEIQTAARTITETDIVNFAGLSGDFNFIHTDAEGAKVTPFGQRVAHGMLVASIASGLAVQHGFIDGTTLAFRELTWKFTRPVLIGDTIQVQVKVIETKNMSKLGGGLVTFEARVVNQRDEVVHKGEWRMLIKGREEARGR